ncbi:MAG: glycosyltransferase family 4 protein [Candidatus Planktophila sp.]
MAAQEKILCITNDFGPRAGGIETFVIGLIERMPRDTVIVYTSAQGDTSAYDAKWLHDCGVEVIRDKSKILLPTPRVGRTVRALVQERGISKAFFGAAAPLGLLAKGLRRAGVSKIVALTHGHEVWWAKVFPFTIAIRNIGKHVDTLTYLGNFTRSAISRSLSTKAQESMVRIAPGIDTSHFAPVDSAQQLKDQLDLAGKRVIVSVGRLVHRKGQDTLVEALPEIVAAFPDAHLLFVGVGPHLEYIHKRAIQLNVLQHISFVGRVQYSELPRFISVGEIFAMPSRSRLAGLEVEGLGIVYLEASACELPVIGGLSGGAPDAVLEGETGFAVDGLNPSVVAAGVIRLLENPDLAKAMGKRGRQWIIDEWEWRHWSERFNSLF